MPTPDIKQLAEAIVASYRNERHDPASTVPESMKTFEKIGAARLEPGAIRSYDTRTLEVLFDAVAIVSEHGSRPDLVPAMEEILQETTRRGYFAPNMIEGMFSRYIELRQLERARRLHRRFPSKDRQLPEILEPASVNDGPAVYVVSADGRSMSYKAVDLEGPLIVSVVTPACPYSRAISSLIAGDKALSRLFATSAVNIEPSSHRFFAEQLSRINAEGGFRYDILYRAHGWPGFDFTVTPTFYFVKGGRILHKMEGADPASFKTGLAKGLGEIGLKL